MKILKRIIYSLLGLLLTGVVVLVGVILFAEYSGQRFSPTSLEAASQTALSDGESRLVYDENGNLAELPAGVPVENTDGESTDDAANSETPSLADAFSDGVTPSETDDSANNATFSDDTTSPATTQETTAAIADASSGNGERLYIMDLGSNLFHTEDCPYAANISDENRSEMTTTRDKIMTAGYQTCTNCNP